MRAELATLDAARRSFHATHLRTTEAVADEIDRDGFLDNAWVSKRDLAFAPLHPHALDADGAAALSTADGVSASTTGHPHHVRPMWTLVAFL